MNSETRTPTGTELNWFGLIVLLFFTIIGTLVFTFGENLSVAMVLWGSGAALTLLYYLTPPFRLPLYRFWMWIFTPIGVAISHLLLGAIYLFILTPTGVMMRLLGKDPMKRRFGNVSSYWIPREGKPPITHYFRQF